MRGADILDPPPTTAYIFNAAAGEPVPKYFRASSKKLETIFGHDASRLMLCRGRRDFVASRISRDTSVQKWTFMNMNDFERSPFSL
jgi:hypothetical protein